MRKKVILLLMFSFALLLSGIVSAGDRANNTYVENIRYGLVKNGVRVVFDLTADVDHRAFVLDDPYRVVIDVPNLNWHHPKTSFVSGNEIIKSYRSGILDNGLTRVVFDLKKPALIKKTFTLDKDDVKPNRLVVDLVEVSKNLFEARENEVFGNKKLAKAISDVKNQEAANKAAAPSSLYDKKVHSDYARYKNDQIAKAKPVKAEPVIEAEQQYPKRRPYNIKKRKYVVVVDAGHGGADPGAVVNGVLEKNITLAIAKELRRQMEETGRYKVVMTRDSDVYVKLVDRKNKARSVNADLFVSVHADSIARKNIRGASIYTLSENASDAETAKLADNANNSGYVAGVDLSHESQEVADILLDLAMREKMNGSNMFARYLQSSLIKGDVKLLPNATRSAGFAVLKAPDVPAVLIEVGFVSNRQEAKMLTTYSFQRKVASSILSGTDLYFRKIEALQKY